MPTSKSPNIKAFTLSIIVSLFLLFLFSFWFIGSRYFPVINIPNQFVGESIYVKSLVIIKPSVLVIYWSENFPLLGEEIVRTTIFEPGIYGNFDLVTFLDRPLVKGNYFAVLYDSEESLDVVNPDDLTVSSDLLGRPIKTIFNLN